MLITFFFFKGHIVKEDWAQNAVLTCDLNTFHFPLGGSLQDWAHAEEFTQKAQSDLLGTIVKTVQYILFSKCQLLFFFFFPFIVGGLTKQRLFLHGTLLFSKQSNYVCYLVYIQLFFFFLKQGTLINMLDLKEASPTESALLVISETFLQFFFLFILFITFLSSTFWVFSNNYA